MTTEQQRKMLEAAAKACGYGELIFCNGADDDGYDDGVWKYTWRRDESGRLLLWNPLANPAGTAEMCAKLDINTFYYLSLPKVECSAEDAGDEQVIRYTSGYANNPGEKLKAWMFAATMVAAKIGGYTDA